MANNEIPTEYLENDDPDSVPRRPLTMFEKIKRMATLQNIPKFVPPSPIKGKKTVIFDLDETLVHTASYKPYKTIEYLKFPSEPEYVFIRPGAKEVLKYSYEMFDLFIFTAANQAYADFIIDTLCPSINSDHRFYRNSCYVENGRLIKYMSMFERQPEDIVLIDDSKIAMFANPENTLKIEPWNGFPDDLVIFNWLIPTLMRIEQSDDVRPIIKDAMEHATRQ